MILTYKKQTVTFEPTNDPAAIFREDVMSQVEENRRHRWPSFFDPGIRTELIVETEDTRAIMELMDDYLDIMRSCWVEADDDRWDLDGDGISATGFLVLVAPDHFKFVITRTHNPIAGITVIPGYVMWG